MFSGCCLVFSLIHVFSCHHNTDFDSPSNEGQRKQPIGRFRRISQAYNVERFDISIEDPPTPFLTHYHMPHFLVTVSFLVATRHLSYHYSVRCCILPAFFLPSHFLPPRGYCRPPFLVVALFSRYHCQPFVPFPRDYPPHLTSLPIDSFNWSHSQGCQNLLSGCIDLIEPMV